MNIFDMARCEALTLKNNRCKLNSLPNNVYCHAHERIRLSGRAVIHYEQQQNPYRVQQPQIQQIQQIQ